ncbi:MAG TPA: M50 family metallopeptidase [Thermoanaerobaculia bacterium]|nr:M50 family metallopeptidase [Thermoanaerobaculia bacterium]
MADGTLSLGSIRGTTIEVEPSFLLLLAFFVVTSLDDGLPRALLWIPVLLISVLIHELAHAGTIGLFGYGSSEIRLRGFGGVTINRRKAKPWHDLLISLAGPLSSFALAWTMYQVPSWLPGIGRDPMLAVLVPFLAAANKWWGIFNLLPVVPLDGGQALRSFLHILTSDRTAFVIAVWVSIVVAVLVAILGILAHLYFMTLFMGFLAINNFQQWQLFKSFRRFDE